MHFQISNFVIVLVSVVVIVVSPIVPAFADPQAMLTAPTIVDVSMTPGTTFSIEISVKCVSMMFGYQFLLSYNSSVLTATSFMSYEPFIVRWPSKVNDTAGYVDVAYCMVIPEWFGFNTSNPAPIIRIDFEVDSYGHSVLDLHDTVLCDVYGNSISHKVGDGFFSNIQMEPPSLPITSEPPSQPAELSNVQRPLIHSIPHVPAPNAVESQSSPDQLLPFYYVVGVISFVLGIIFTFKAAKI